MARTKMFHEGEVEGWERKHRLTSLGGGTMLRREYHLGKVCSWRSGQNGGVGSPLVWAAVPVATNAKKGGLSGERNLTQPEWELSKLWGKRGKG